MQIREQTGASPVPPLGGEHDQIQGVSSFDLEPARTAIAGSGGRARGWCAVRWSLDRSVSRVQSKTDRHRRGSRSPTGPRGRRPLLARRRNRYRCGLAAVRPTGNGRQFRSLRAARIAAERRARLSWFCERGRRRRAGKCQRGR
jgi:hypothetical protein